MVDTSTLHNGRPGHATFDSYGFQILMQPIGHTIRKKDEVCLPEGWDFFKDLVAESGDITPFEMHVRSSRRQRRRPE